PTSLTNLVNHFNNVEGVPVKRETIAGYLRLLESAKVLYKCERFDLKSRRSLRGELCLAPRCILPYGVDAIFERFLFLLSTLIREN
ncbi:MAG: hypothetical protein Q4C09_07910, partial [Atopobiaceae bacterium]|nr:hypothetical protein [Atopobiaceae bacterium]